MIFQDEKHTINMNRYILLELKGANKSGYSFRLQGE